MIIGIVGFLNSGKGTVGDLLANKYGFDTDSFARPLKDAASNIFGWDREMVEGKTKESREWRETVDEYWAKALNKPDFTPRLALQWLGTESGRNVFGENLWTASCLKRCEGFRNVVITDVRFRNELKAVKEAGGIIVRVQRGHDPQWVDDAIAHMDEITQRDIELKLPQNIVEFDRHVTLRQYMYAHMPELHPSEWDWVGSEFDHIILNRGNADNYIAIMDDQLRDILKQHNTNGDVI
jgi:hypothetical protein